MLSQQQIDGIRFLILQTDLADDLTKKILCVLLDESKNLTLGKYISLRESDGWSIKEIQLVMDSISRMCSFNCSFHLQQLMIVSGSIPKFSRLLGVYYDENAILEDGQRSFVKSTNEKSITLWLCKEEYGHGEICTRVNDYKVKIQNEDLLDRLYDHSPTKIVA